MLADHAGTEFDLALKNRNVEKTKRECLFSYR